MVSERASVSKRSASIARSSRSPESGGGSQTPGRRRVPIDGCAARSRADTVPTRTVAPAAPRKNPASLSRSHLTQDGLGDDLQGDSTADGSVAQPLFGVIRDHLHRDLGMRERAKSTRWFGGPHRIAERCPREPWPGSAPYRVGPDTGAVVVRVWRGTMHVAVPLHHPL